MIWGILGDLRKTLIQFIIIFVSSTLVAKTLKFFIDWIARFHIVVKSRDNVLSLFDFVKSMGYMYFDFFCNCPDLAHRSFSAVPLTLNCNHYCTRPMAV